MARWIVDRGLPVIFAASERPMLAMCCVSKGYSCADVLRTVRRCAGFGEPGDADAIGYEAQQLRAGMPVASPEGSRKQHPRRGEAPRLGRLRTPQRQPEPGL